MEELVVVHAGARVVVVNKPAGLLSVPGKPVPGGADNRDCVAARVRGMFPGASGPLIAHRLDMETSGLMVLGLGPGAHRDLSMQFERREVGKAYVGVVGGGVAGAAGRITLRIRADIGRRPLQIVDAVQGKEAVTEWSVVESDGETTRLQLVPLTGRTHQLRIHLADPLGLGAPILGDTLYGGRRAARLMLHAAFLAFRDPETGGRVEFTSDAPF